MLLKLSKIGSNFSGSLNSLKRIPGKFCFKIPRMFLPNITMNYRKVIRLHHLMYSKFLILLNFLFEIYL